ncbi:MAG: transposase [Mariprofundaceae bacterium]|nr:transposase [Mariprofundaceae bacterium]
MVRRYQQLVKEHANSTDKLASGLRSLPCASKSSFASTQAAWRFYQNDKVSLSKLSEPLLEAAHDGVSSRCTRYALCVHDWSRLNYYKHTSKEDRYQMSHETDVGYDLQSSLLVSADSGKPIAPVAQRLVTSDMSYATYQKEENPEIKAHLDEVTDCMKWIETQKFAKPLVHIIDREADSIGHIRQWEDTNMLWMTRSRISSHVEYRGESMRCEDVANQLKFTKVRKVKCKNKVYWQWVAETPIRIIRQAKPSQKKQKKPAVSGDTVDARLVVSRILSKSGEVIANWLLITNVQDVNADEIALWYYWRWNIESWFKLLKSAGGTGSV